MPTISFRMQRNSVQSAVDKYFGRTIDIAPRAFAALQGLRRTKDGHSYIAADDILDGLFQCSLASLMAVADLGISLEFLVPMIDTYSTDGPGRLEIASLDHIFCCLPGRRPGDPWRDGCASYEGVKQSGRLSEDDLLNAFVQTLYVGPTVVDQLSSPCEFAGILGRRLIETGFVEDWDFVIESTDTDDYKALLVAGQRLTRLQRSMPTIAVSDPSHELQQLALWSGVSGKIHVRPFGATGVGRSAESGVASPRELMCREDLFQPLSGVGYYAANATLELEDMINSSRVSEADFQKFFEHHPEFLTGLDYSQVHPQLVLFNESGSARIPDFMLEPLSSEFCDLLELKLPYEDMVRRLRKSRRARFKDFVDDSIAQLLEYRRYFEDLANRRAFHQRYGLQAYHPTMILVCGRRHHFKSDLERRELRALLPADLALWTYDDLLDRARNYQKFQQNLVKQRL